MFQKIRGTLSRIKEFIKNGIKNKILSENAIYESLIAFKRAGANAIVTYFADEIVDKLK